MWTCCFIFIASWITCIRADFSYSSFTTPSSLIGLRLVGSTSYNTCINQTYIAPTTIIVDQQVQQDVQQTVVIVPNPSTTSPISTLLHDSDSSTQSTVTPNTTCIPGIRLTKAQPHQVGGIWHTTEQPVMDGFETSFSFKIHNASSTCEYRIERDTLNTIQYIMCPDDDMLHPASNSAQHMGTHVITQSRGGDGLAFVIRGDGITTTVGADGEGMGWRGITPSLVIELDTYANRNLEDGEEQHISIIASTSTSTSTLCPPYRTRLRDNNIHDMKIIYYPTLRMDYMRQGLFCGSEEMSTYIHASLGTLCLHLDSSTPIFCLPLDLSSLLTSSDGRAHVGFTASTGESYQVHDVWNWKFCWIPGACQVG